MTILIILDGCGYAAASENLGFAEHMTEQGLAAKYKVTGELPGLSRPMYETLHTGLPVNEHGITNNLIVRRSNCTSVFDLCRNNGLSTAAAAYYWISELYVRSPFDYIYDRIQLDKDSAVQNGIYYYEDFYPDSHVFADAEFLRCFCSPDFMLVHPMQIDFSGHRYGSDSIEYREAIAKEDTILSTYIPLWMSSGYDIILTADHGMNEFRLHGGNSSLQRDVPLYIFSPKVNHGNFTEKPISQLSIAPLICALLEIPPSPEMRTLEASEVNFFEK